MFFIALGISGCKSKKKAMEAQSAKAKMEQEAADRRLKEEELRQKQAAEEKARRDSEAKKQLEAKANVAPKARLGQYFDAISSATNPASANASINEALALFASPETPVLIIISEENGEKDYDKPTTIKAYLNYLKDQKKSINTPYDLQFDSTGKITALELKKTY